MEINRVGRTAGVLMLSGDLGAGDLGLQHQQVHD
jgi:hypothetical protein